MYTTRNFKTKKALKEAVSNGERVTFFQPGIFDNSTSSTFTGTIYVEGPHYPEPHRWYAKCEAVDGKIVKVS